eukprot:7865935-Pyramimonas_sp.AAC.1
MHSSISHVEHRPLNPHEHNAFDLTLQIRCRYCVATFTSQKPTTEPALQCKGDWYRTPSV